MSLELFNSFMKSYWWAYLIYECLLVVANWDKPYRTERYEMTALDFATYILWVWSWRF